MKRYLVTGGAGFIGSAIVKRLVVAENHYVRVLDNGSRGSEKNIKNLQNVEFFYADIRDKKKVEKACEDIDIIIHLAFVNGTKNFYEHPDLVLDVGVKGMINILDGAKLNKVPELFLASSSEVYQTPKIIPTPETASYFIPDPLNPRYSYAGGKIISEMLSLFAGSKIFKKIVIFRPHNVYGPNMGTEHVIPELIKKIIVLNLKSKKIIDLPIQGNGNDTRSFIYIDDFVEGLMLLLKKGKNKEIYNIGTEEEITIKGLVSLLSKVINKQIEIITGKKPKGSVSRRCPNMTKLFSLGFSPKYSILEGLSKTYLWYNKNLIFDK